MYICFVCFMTCNLDVYLEVTIKISAVNFTKVLFLIKYIILIIS